MEEILKRTAIVVAGLSALVVVVGVIVWWLVGRPEVVDAVQVDAREVVEVYVSTGLVVAPRTSLVSSETSGRVTAVHVQAGQRVATEDPLVTLQATAAQLELDAARSRLATAVAEEQRASEGETPARIRASAAVVDQAEVDLAEAQRTLALAQAMVARSTGTADAVDRATSQVARSEAALAQAQAQLRQMRAPARSVDVAVAAARVEEASIAVAVREHALTTVTTHAPFAGLVVALHVRDGEVVAPGQTMIELVDLDSREVVVEIDEAVVSRLAPGMVVRAVVPALNGISLEGTVRQIGPRVDPGRGIVDVHIDLGALDDDLLPGFAVDVAIELQRLRSALSVPRGAVARTAAGGDAVFVIRDGVMHRVPIRVVAEGDESYAIEGVSAGALVARDASRGEDGLAVRTSSGNAVAAEASGSPP